MLPCSWGVLENPAGIHIHVVEPQQASRKIRNAGCPRLVPWPETFLWFISDAAFNFEKSSQVNECLFLLSSKRFYCCGFLADCIGCLASATSMFMKCGKNLELP